jgi:hypothetical protein
MKLAPVPCEELVDSFCPVLTDTGRQISFVQANPSRGAATLDLSEATIPHEGVSGTASVLNDGERRRSGRPRPGGIQPAMTQKVSHRA